MFYLDLKHVHKYDSAQFQPNSFFFSLQRMATKSAESVAEKKEKKWDSVGGRDDQGIHII